MSFSNWHTVFVDNKRPVKPNNVTPCDNRVGNVSLSLTSIRLRVPVSRGAQVDSLKVQITAIVFTRRDKTRRRDHHTMITFTVVLVTCSSIHPRAIHPSTHPATRPSVCLSICSSTQSLVHVSVHLSIHPPTYLSVYLSIRSSTHPSTDPSIHPPICLVTCPSIPNRSHQLHCSYALAAGFLIYFIFYFIFN